MTVIKNAFSKVIEVSHPGGYKLSLYEVCLSVTPDICVTHSDTVTLMTHLYITKNIFIYRM